MEFIILPLSYRTKEEKQRKIRETVELATKIQDREQQLFTLAGILAFTDKLIDRETAGRIRRAIEMTQVAQIFEEEKQQALTQVAQIFEEEKQQALTQAAQTFEAEKRQALTQAAQIFEEEKRQAVQQTAQDYKEKNRQELAKVVIRMIQKDYPTEEIVTMVSGYSQDEVEALRKDLAEKGNANH